MNRAWLMLAVFLPSLTGCIGGPDLEVSYETRYSDNGRFSFRYIKVLNKQSTPVEIQDVILNEHFHPIFLCSTENDKSSLFPDLYVKPQLDEAFSVMNGQPSYGRRDNGKGDKTHYYFHPFRISMEKRRELGDRLMDARSKSSLGFDCPILYVNDTLRMGGWREFGLDAFATQDSVPQWFGANEPITVTVKTDQGDVTGEIQANP